MSNVQESALSDVIPVDKIRQTKKDLIESVKINEDDYNYIALNVIPEMDDLQSNLIKRYFGYTKEELLDGSNVEICYKYFITKYIPPDSRRDLQSINITNENICDILYYSGRKVDSFFKKLCLLEDAELFFILQNFLVRFYNLIVYLIAKQIKINNLNEEYLESKFLDEEFLFFMQYMVSHGEYTISVKRLDFISDVNKFFKIKNIDYINLTKIRGKDDIILIIISKMFRILFYHVLLEMNIRHKKEEAEARNNTLDIIDEMYEYFYRKVYLDMSGECEGVVCDIKVESEPEIYLGEDQGEN